MQISVHGTPINLVGKELLVGKEAPAARITKLDATHNVIGMIAPKVQLIISIPSLKTEVCSLGAQKFNDLVEGFTKLKTIMVTTDDLDFVQEYVTKESLKNVEVVVDKERNFAQKFGLLISEGKLKERLARAVFVIDTEGIIAYKEIVLEVVDEVNYDACMEAISQLLNQKKRGHTHENWMSL